MVKVIIAANLSEGFSYVAKEGIPRSEVCILVTGYGNTWYRIKGLRFKPEDVTVLDFIPEGLMRLLAECYRRG